MKWIEMSTFGLVDRMWGCYGPGNTSCVISEDKGVFHASLRYLGVTVYTSGSMDSFEAAEKSLERSLDTRV